MRQKYFDRKTLLEIRFDKCDGNWIARMTWANLNNVNGSILYKNNIEKNNLFKFTEQCGTF